MLKKWSRRIAIGMSAMAVIILCIAVILWFISPTLARDKAIEKAKQYGVALIIQSAARSPNGFIFSGVHLSSDEFPIVADFDTVQVVLNGSRLQSVEIIGGQVQLHGALSEVRGKISAWRLKHPSHGSGEKAAITASGLKVDWAMPCGVEDASATNVSLNNEMDFHADDATVQCFGWKAHATGLQINKHDAKSDTLDVTKIDKGPSNGLPGSSDSLPEKIFVNHHVPNIFIGEFSIAKPGLSAHAKNASASVALLGDAIGIDTEADVIDADLPKVHKIALGKTAFKLHVYQHSPDIIDFSMALKADKAQGKYQAVTGKKVSFGPMELHVEGFVVPSPAWSSPHVGILRNGDRLSGSFLKVKDAEIDFYGIWDSQAFDVNLALPLTPCQSLLESIPEGMNSALAGMEMDGKAGVDLHLVDVSPTDEPAVKLRLINTCRIIKEPEVGNRATLRSSFTRLVPGQYGEPLEIVSGPTSGKWTPISQMSPFLISAIQVTEDPGFFSHYGFDEAAIESSIRADITSGTFVRGASTVTMQLAKNIWLSREKTLARKIQEAFLTVFLEEKLSKQEILETYFNVVQFGPSTYGIGDAAMHYFKTKPADLSLSQSLFLTSVLPNPKIVQFSSDGKLHSERQRWLTVLMAALLHRHLITPAQYAEGVTEIVVRGQPLPDHQD